MWAAKIQISDLLYNTLTFLGFHVTIIMRFEGFLAEFSLIMLLICHLNFNIMIYQIFQLKFHPYTWDFTMGSKESKIRAIIIELVSWFFGPDFWPSCPDGMCCDTHLLCSCHDGMCCDFMTLIHANPKCLPIAEFTDWFGVIAQSNHFNNNNMIFIISRKFTYISK